MITTGSRNLKNHLGRYLTSVKNGEEVLITIHGEAIARIVPEPSKKISLRDRLAQLVSKGLIDLPKKNLDKNFNNLPKLKGKALSDIVIEERR